MGEKLTLYHHFERAYGKLFHKKPKRNPFNFEIHLTDSCNLSCKGCMHFAPLAKGNTDYPLEEFESDFARISTVFKGRFGWVHLLGGEPLLNKRINEYLDIVGRNVKNGTVDLITNGLLLPSMDESFFVSCKKNNIRIAITKYPVGFDYDKALEAVLSRGCQGYFFGDRGREGEFCSPSLVPDSSASPSQTYFHCVLANACVTLDHGKLTYCSLPAFARLYNDYFGKTFEAEGEFIDIYENDKKAIVDFLRTPHAFCRYCDIKTRDNNPVKWEQSKKRKEEWLK